MDHRRSSSGSPRSKNGSLFHISDTKQTRSGAGEVEKNREEEKLYIANKKNFWWDKDREQISGTEKAWGDMREKWIDRGLSVGAFEAGSVALNIWLEDRPGKRRKGANFANRLNNWMLTQLTRGTTSRSHPKSHEGMISPSVEWRTQDEASIRACPRDHDRERIKSATGRMWMCPDVCGWCERVIETVELES